MVHCDLAHVGVQRGTWYLSAVMLLNVWVQNCRGWGGRGRKERGEEESEVRGGKERRGERRGGEERREEGRRGEERRGEGRKREGSGGKERRGEERGGEGRGGEGRRTGRREENRQLYRYDQNSEHTHTP